MKIAFVNQPFDSILPPVQSSVGACTYGTARSLAHTCQVSVYGRRSVGSHSQFGAEFQDDRGVHYHFLSPPLWDRVPPRLFKKLWQYPVVTQIGNRGMKPPISTSGWLYPVYGHQVAADLQAQQPDIIHVQHCSQYIPAIRALNPQAKIVLHLHAEWFPQSDPVTLNRRLQCVDLVTCVSDHITDRTRRDFPRMADRCHTVYNGIEIAEFARAKDYSSASQTRSPLRIMYAGAVSPHKGLHVLLQAMEILVQRVPNVHLEIVGPQGAYPIEESFPMNDRGLVEQLQPLYNQDYVEYLQQHMPAAIAAQVSFAGAIPRADLLERYRQADLFVFPPIWDEGFGIPPVEAMAAGVPVVATRSGAVVETVVDGKTGLLVDKYDAPALAAAMARLLEDAALRERMGTAGRQRVWRYFTWDRVAETLYRHYERLLTLPAPTSQLAKLAN